MTESWQRRSRRQHGLRLCRKRRPTSCRSGSVPPSDETKFQNPSPGRGRSPLLCGRSPRHALRREENFLSKKDEWQQRVFELIKQSIAVRQEKIKLLW